LPPESLVRTKPEERGRNPWDAYMELLAQLVEVSSVTAAGFRLKKPIKVPRPGRKRKRGRQAESFQTVDTDSLQVHQLPSGPNPYSAAMNMLAGSSPARLHVVQDGETASGEQETA
jgi:hypothetical protein